MMQFYVVQTMEHYHEGAIGSHDITLYYNVTLLQS